MDSVVEDSELWRCFISGSVEAGGLRHCEESDLHPSAPGWLPGTGSVSAPTRREEGFVISLTARGKMSHLNRVEGADYVNTGLLAC